MATTTETPAVEFPTERTTPTAEMHEELRYQGVGRRAVALVVDGVVLAVAFWALGMLVGGLTGGLTTSGFELTGTPALVFFLGVTAIGFGYFIVLEARYGQTLGKRLAGIRVVTEDGEPIDVTASTVRNVLRIVDGIGFYLLGALFVWTSERKQRLGDRVADTAVVRAR